MSLTFIHQQIYGRMTDELGNFLLSDSGHIYRTHAGDDFALINEVLRNGFGYLFSTRLESCKYMHPFDGLPVVFEYIGEKTANDIMYAHNVHFDEKTAAEDRKLKSL